MVHNAADRKSIRRAEKEARLHERRMAEVVSNLMSYEAGREFVWNILSDCMVFSTTFTGDALTSAFNEGRRSAGCALLASIMLACPDQYIQAQRESNERSSLNERRSRAESDGGDLGS